LQILFYCALFFLIGLIVGELATPIKAIGFRIREPRFYTHKEHAIKNPSPFIENLESGYINESERAFVIRDKKPRAPIHFLIIPKKRVINILDAPEDLVAEMIELAKTTAIQYGISESGFRLVINTNPQGLQTVYHLHIHLLGGRQLRVPFW
jgi:histidine triad (HIT) family protein